MLLLNAVDCLRQRRAVIVRLWEHKGDVRIRAAVDVIEGTVLCKCQTGEPGDLKESTVGRSQWQYYATSTTGCLADQCHLMGILKNIRHKVSAGEAV